MPVCIFVDFQCNCKVFDIFTGRFIDASKFSGDIITKSEISDLFQFLIKNYGCYGIHSVIYLIDSIFEHKTVNYNDWTKDIILNTRRPSLILRVFNYYAYSHTRNIYAARKQGWQYDVGDKILIINDKKFVADEVVFKAHCKSIALLQKKDIGWDVVGICRWSRGLQKALNKINVDINDIKSVLYNAYNSDKQIAKEVKSIFPNEIIVPVSDPDSKSLLSYMARVHGNQNYDEYDWFSSPFVVDKIEVRIGKTVIPLPFRGKCWPHTITQKLELNEKADLLTASYL